MKTYLKLELKRSICSIRTLISILILVVPFSFISSTVLQYKDTYVDGIDFFFILYDNYYTAYFVPIVCIIYSVTVVKDKRNGFLDKLLEIIDIKSYIKGKLIVNAAVNTFILVASYGVFIIFFIALFGIGNTEVGGINSGLYLISAFSRIYYKSKIAYLIVVSIMTILSAITFSSLVLVITMIANRVYVPYLFTVFFIIMTSIVMSMYGLNNIINFNIMRQFYIVSNDVNAMKLLSYDIFLVLVTYSTMNVYLKKFKKSLCN